MNFKICLKKNTKTEKIKSNILTTYTETTFDHRQLVNYHGSTKIIEFM